VKEFNAAPPAAVAPGFRVRLRHHVIKLADGHPVGVSLAGGGIPLVFLHGIALNTKVYARMLRDLPQLGFLVVAIDAPAHGDTPPLSARSSFGERAALIDRTLDELGIVRAVLVGHSMGGRNVIELAAAHPGRVISAVLLDAAAGTTFDTTGRRAAESVPTLVTSLLRARWDARSGLSYLSQSDRASYRQLKRRLTWLAMRSPTEIQRTARAIAQATETTEMLGRMRQNRISTIVVHGTHDLVIPLESAFDCAYSAGAALYLLPHGYHSWLLPDPHLATDTISRLLRAELGQAIRDAAVELGLPAEAGISHWQAACLEPDARLLDLLHEPEPAGQVVDYYGPPQNRAARVELVQSDRPRDYLLPTAMTSSKPAPRHSV
jgi:pimeloyl-ACP methyl ester carboxylesterase